MPTLSDLERDAMDARIDRWKEMRRRWEADIDALMTDDKEGVQDLSEIINGLQEIEGRLFMAEVREQADLDAESPSYEQEQRSMIAGRRL